MSASNRDHPHLLFVPSGIGSLNPFFQLALKLLSHNCKATFINLQPQTSASNSPHYLNFFSNHKEIELLDLEIKTSNASNSAKNDPFMTHFKNINHSLNNLLPILSSTPISAIISDFALVETLVRISDEADITLYVLSTTSAQFFSTVAYLPVLMDEDSNIFNRDIKIPGLGAVSKSNIPSTWMNGSYLLMDYLLPNARSLSKAKGVVLNTFDWFEQETIGAIVDGRILKSLPHVFPIGPLKSCESSHQRSDLFSWLDKQADKSVVYVDFGRREVLSMNRRRELVKGLEMSGYKYLWVIQENEMDRGKIEEFQDFSISEGCENKCKMIKDGVNHGNVLAHPAVGGFVNGCEWESVMYGAWHGVPMVAWPLHGDQMMNAEIVEKTGLGISVKDWSREGEKPLEGKDIGRVVEKIMGDINIKKKDNIVKAKAWEACAMGGRSEQSLLKFIEMVSRSDGN